MSTRRATLADFLREVDIAPSMQDTLARIVKNLGGGRPPFVFSTTAITPLTNAVEGVTCTTPPLNPGLDASQVLLVGCWNTQAIGTTGNAASASIRRGTAVSGGLISSAFNTTVVAAQIWTAWCIGVDTPGAVAGQQYSLTGAVAAATANTAISAAFLMAMSIG